MAVYLKNARKVTVTLPDELVVYADSQAERSGTSRSQVISQALAYHMAAEEERLAAEEERLAAEGYAFYAAEAEEFAAGAASATAEAWPAEPQDEARP